MQGSERGVWGEGDAGGSSDSPPFSPQKMISPLGGGLYAQTSCGTRTERELNPGLGDGVLSEKRVVEGGSHRQGWGQIGGDSPSDRSQFGGQTE